MTKGRTTMQPIDAKKQAYDEARASLEEAQGKARKIHEDLNKALGELNTARQALDMRSTRIAREKVTDLEGVLEEVGKVIRERQEVATAAQREYQAELAIIRRAQDERELEALRVKGAEQAEHVFAAWRAFVGTLEDFAGIAMQANTIQAGARLEFQNLLDGVRRTEADALEVGVSGPFHKPAMTVGLTGHPMAPSDGFAILARRFAERERDVLAMPHHETTLPVIRTGDAA